MREETGTGIRTGKIENIKVDTTYAHNLEARIKTRIDKVINKIRESKTKTEEAKTKIGEAKTKTGGTKTKIREFVKGVIVPALRSL